MKDLSKSLSIHLPTHCDTKKKKERMAHLFYRRDRKSGNLVVCPDRVKTFSQLLKYAACFFWRVFFLRVFASQLPQTFYFILFFIFYLLSYIYREKIDTDGDGSISKEEFIRGYSIWQMHIKKAQMLQVSFFFFTKQ